MYSKLLGFPEVMDAECIAEYFANASNWFYQQMTCISLTVEVRTANGWACMHEKHSKVGEYIVEGGVIYRLQKFE